MSSAKAWKVLVKRTVRASFVRCSLHRKELSGPDADTFVQTCPGSGPTQDHQGAATMKEMHHLGHIHQAQGLDILTVIAGLSFF